jgi:hypothetical protein
VKIYSTYKKYEADSVEYRGPGHDNTLQVTPYWKIHLKGTDIWLTSYYRIEVNDTVEVIEKRLIEKVKNER